MSDATQDFYSGHELLLKCEKILVNYHSWIVKRVWRYAQRVCPPHPKVMEFGAGVGTLAALFAAQSGLRPATVEIDPRQRAILVERGFSSYASLEDIQETFDLIYTSNVLEHIENDGEALRMLRAKLTEDGCLVVYVPAFMCIWSPLDDKVGHFRRYTKKTLSEALEAAGYYVQDITYCDSVGFLLSILFKIIGSKSGEPGSVSLVIFDKILFPVSLALDTVCGKFFGKNVLALARVSRLRYGASTVTSSKETPGTPAARLG